MVRWTFTPVPLVAGVVVVAVTPARLLLIARDVRKDGRFRVGRPAGLSILGLTHPFIVDGAWMAHMPRAPGLADRADRGGAP